MATKGEKFWFTILTAAAAGYIHNEKKKEEAKKENREYSSEEAFANVIKAAALGGLGGRLFAEIAGTPSDTVNYKGYNRKNEIVYHGITLKERIHKRIAEHMKAGKKFSKVVYDEAKPRCEASELEKLLIKKHKPLYNVQHNCN